MTEARLLVVEDDPDQLRLVAGILRRQSYFIAEATSVDAALELLETSPVDLVLSDWKLGDRDGLDLLAALRERHPETAFILMTAHGTISHAVEALRLGADDYLAKPFEREGLLLSVERTLRARRLADENRRLTEELGEREQLVDLVGRSPAMQQVFRRLEKLAGTEATVLLTGESGTGKELAARALHSLSRRSNGPFVAVNCAAIPEGLIEAEFFGAERGAYTGADRSREGKFEAARGGTLFLDEVGELPPAMQPKLLRVLQEGRVTRVGSTREVEVDTRIVSATNRDLAAEATAGRFREDLFYRLNVVSVRMPPLRERREDISRLVKHLVERSCRRHGLRVEPFGTALMKRLVDHAWPGNVRELGNVVERLVLLAEDDRVQVEDLPDELSARAQGDGGFRLPPGGLSWDEHERSCLAQALELAGGNRARAARLLDLPYKAFLYRLEKHGLDGRSEEGRETG
ncbi:MAG: sigma-54 dependent transcriptional regulator [Acidobacteriota bacterium]